MYVPFYLIKFNIPSAIKADKTKYIIVNQLPFSPNQSQAISFPFINPQIHRPNIKTAIKVNVNGIYYPLSFIYFNIARNRNYIQTASVKNLLNHSFILL
jgi:hypothetical protein